MPTLLEKIEAHAAQRLVLPAHQRPAQELTRYKHFLKVETHRLKMLHRAGAGGLEVCRGRAAVLDVLLQHIVKAVIGGQLAGQSVPAFALIALGGYGRGELNPGSDIDLMFLHEGDLREADLASAGMKALIDGVLYTLWDTDVKVGHVVRGLNDCDRVPNQDIRSKTALLESRLVIGNEDLYRKMVRVFQDKCVRGHEEEYIAARLRDQSERRARFGNSACMQEPNIKNGCGGLRDYQNLLWMACFKFGIGSLGSLQAGEQLNEREQKKLEAAYDFLLRVRNELHYQQETPGDVLAKSLQPAVAHCLGYLDRSPVRRVERFMRDLYVHARNIYLITRTLEQRLALLPRPRRLPSFRDFLRQRRQNAQYPVDGFKFIDGEVYPASPRTLADQPRRLMRVFLHAQQRGLRLNPDVTQLLRNHLSLVDRQFLQDQHVRETFLEILSQRGNVAHILRSMHEVGLLGKYLPEFGRLTCLVQHEFFHQYAADEHTLVCVEKLDQIWGSEQPPYSHYKPLFQGLERPFVLYLALLLHDVGKADRTGRHSEVGGQVAIRVAARLGLNAATTQALRVLVENHLLMAQISQRRDLDDPVVIRNFAERARTAEGLALLTLHTFADSNATSDTLWNDFKESLLWTLHDKALRVLTGGTEFQRKEEKQRELLALEVRRLAPPSIAEEEVQAHFANLPPRYFQIHSAHDIATDVLLTHRFIHLQLSDEDRALEPVITWHNEPDRGYTAVKICTWDRAGLFSQIAGSLTAAGLNILSAQIFSRQDGIILDTFFVHEADTGKPVAREARDKFDELLRQELINGVDSCTLIIPRTRTRPLYQAFEDGQIPTVIHFDNAASDTCTIIDVEAEDHVGLLYAISKTLSRLGLDISLAKVCTEKGAAIDTFYVRDAADGKVRQPERLKAIEQKLREAIATLA
jgi:[protein-PII] uridylyltransferase